VHAPSSASDVRSEPLISLGRLPARVRSELRSALARSERIVWVGQPVRIFPPEDRTLRVLALVVIPPALIAAALGVWQATFSGPGERGASLAEMFIGLLLVVLLLPFAGERIDLKKTAYILTDRRILIWQGHLFRVRPAMVLYASELSEMHVASISRKGVGDLIMKLDRRLTADGYIEKPTGFMGIANAEEVEELVRATLLRQTEVEPAQSRPSS
jgi:hypothetical protein